MAKIIRLNSSIMAENKTEYNKTTSDIVSILQAKQEIKEKTKNNLNTMGIKNLECVLHTEKQLSAILFMSDAIHPKTLERLENEIESSFDPLAVESPAIEDEIHEEMLYILKHDKPNRKKYLDQRMKRKTEEYTQAA